MNKEKFKSLLIVLGVIVVIFAVTYLFVSAIVGVLAFCFGFIFTWKLSLGVYILLNLFLFASIIKLSW